MDNKNLLKKLLEIQKKVDYFKKDAKGYNFFYVSGTEILQKIRPLMDEQKLLLIQSVKDISIIEMKINKKNQESINYVTQVNFDFTWVDTESGETLIIGWSGQGQDNSDKGFGMSCTYAERYFLLKFFHIPTDEDDPDSKGKAKWNSKQKITEILNLAYQIREKMTGKEQNYFQTLQANKPNYTEQDYKNDMDYINEIQNRVMNQENKEPEPEGEPEESEDLKFDPEGE